jgi:hypothetical protein
VYGRLLKHRYRELEGPAYDGKEAETAKQKSKYFKTVVYSA